MRRIKRKHAEFAQLMIVLVADEHVITHSRTHYFIQRNHSCAVSDIFTR